MEPVPRSAQQSIDAEAGSWAEQWASTRTMPECIWPSDLGPPPALLELALLRRELATFPAHLGLGWDGLHPRALLRLPDVVLQAVLRLLFLCECHGRWPSLSTLVVIALLPK